MEESSANASETIGPPAADTQPSSDGPTEVKSAESLSNPEQANKIESKDESGICVNGSEERKSGLEVKDAFIEQDSCEVNEDARSVGELDSLAVGDEPGMGAAGSDSGVEGCGRALSSGGGSRSCASSVVSCGSGCGSESSSLGAPPRPRRRVVTLDTKRPAPLGTSTPRPVTAPRGPNLATRERARSREKPTPPEKPRPLTPKPRIRPTGDLPNLVRESPALRAKPTKTSTARCRTPNSPSDEKKWPSFGTPRMLPATDASATATRIAADKYGTLPRRRRDGEPDGSPKHEGTPPSRRPNITRTASSRSVTKTRVRIYAEKVSQTVLLGSDIEAALAGITPNIENHVEVTKCHRGVQASSRDSELARLSSAVAAAEAAAAEERQRREHLEAQLAAERTARLAAIAELESNSQKLLELAGAGASGGTDGCLRALEEQIKSAAELAARQRNEIDSLRAQCDKLHAEAISSRESARCLQSQLAEAEREAQEMQDFLAAETGALTDSLRDAEAELASANALLERRRLECRQLVRLCEQRRQEALTAAARASNAAPAHRALAHLDHRLAILTDTILAAYNLPPEALQQATYHNDAYSRSDSGDAASPSSPLRGGLLAALTRAARHLPPTPPANPEDDRSKLSDDNDNSADLLDSETEPCFVMDPECTEEWWSGAEGGGGWSADELSPEREPANHIDKEGESASASDRDSLRNLSAAITQRHRSEAEAADGERGSLLERVVSLDNRLSDLLRALRLAASAAARHDDRDCLALALALRDKIDVTEKNVADVVVKKLAELDASKNMMEQYRHSVETLKKQLGRTDEDEDLQYIEQELSSCGEAERRQLYEALDGALGVLSSRARSVRAWPRLASLHAKLERLAFAVAAPPPVQQPLPVTPLHTTA